MTRVHIYADVAELADALDSGSSEGNFMWVQVPSSAPSSCDKKDVSRFCRIKSRENGLFRNNS